MPARREGASRRLVTNLVDPDYLLFSHLPSFDPFRRNVVELEQLLGEGLIDTLPPNPPTMGVKPLRMPVWSDVCVRTTSWAFCCGTSSIGERICRTIVWKSASNFETLLRITSISVSADLSSAITSKTSTQVQQHCV